MAITNNRGVASRLAAAVAREHPPREADVLRRLQLGRVQRIAIRPSVFSASLFPVMWAASWINASPDVYLWEKIRPLDPLPVNYCERYSNVQAAIGLEGLAHLDEWTDATIQHARELNDALADTGIETPAVPASARHVFYQYAIYAPRRDDVVRGCLRRGIDVESLHVDVCTRLPIFENGHAPAPGAERAAQAIQLPVYASLKSDHIDRIASVVREAVGT
jgi:hypothetical protein